MRWGQKNRLLGSGQYRLAYTAPSCVCIRRHPVTGRNHDINIIPTTSSHYVIRDPHCDMRTRLWYGVIQLST